jgi:hypothetical protein
MKIVSWNLGANSGGYAARHADTWEYLLEELRPDVALVQEAVPPPRGIGRMRYAANPWLGRSGDHVNGIGLRRWPPA